MFNINLWLMSVWHIMLFPFLADCSMTQQFEESDSVNDESADSGACLCCFPSASQSGLSRDSRHTHTHETWRACCCMCVYSWITFSSQVDPRDTAGSITLSASAVDCPDSDGVFHFLTSDAHHVNLFLQIGLLAQLVKAALIVFSVLGGQQIRFLITLLHLKGRCNSAEPRVQLLPLTRGKASPRLLTQQQANKDCIANSSLFTHQADTAALAF